MNGLEICLVIIGLVFVACSFIFSEHLMSGDMKDDMINGVNVANVTEEIVKREVEAEIANLIDEKLDAMELAVDKITTSKLMAMGQYSEEIQKKIADNHDEVMFLYNMLNDKEEVLKNTIRDIEAVKASVKKMAIVNEVANDVTKKPIKTTQTARTSQHIIQGGTQVSIAGEQLVQPDIQKDSIDKATQAAELSSVAEQKVVPVSSEKELNERKRDISNNNQLILDLYAKGKTNIEIAKELGLGIGEVRLVIDLFNAR